MCGIFGVFYSKSTEVTADLLTHACEILNHRGPDDRSQWIHPTKKIGLAHTRLSVLDLDSRARQPFESASKRSMLVFNGEIYNYQKLGLSLNCPLVTTSDTEILIEYLEKNQLAGLHDLDGMFAFGCLNEKQILLAVDPVGKKPLYTFWDGQTFAFSSEIKAFRAVPSISLDIEKSHLAEFVVSGYVTSPSSIYKNVKKLEPGHYQIFDFKAGLMPSKPYWDLPLGQRLVLSYDEAKEELQKLIAAAVRKRLVSDVPLGVFLSGGVDSSVIAYEAQRLSDSHKIKTFSASFQNDPLFSIYDESAFAKFAAAKIETTHLSIDAAYDFNAEEILNHFDEPYADSSCFPFSILSKKAKSHVSVALTGDGGDEIFGGYLRMRAGLIGDSVTSLLSPLFFYVPNRVKARQGLFAYMSRFKNALTYPLLNRLVLWTSFFDQKDFSFYVSQNIEKMFFEADRWNEKLKSLETGEQILHFNFKTYLTNDLLPKIDRMSMLYGLEVRSPFLDKALIEFMFKLPTKYKFDFFRGKKILKDSYRAQLGPEIVDRKKKGFGFPLESFLKKKTDFELICSKRYFMHLPRNLKDLKGRNLSSKQFLLYALENFLARHYAPRA